MKKHKYKVKRIILPIKLIFPYKCTEKINLGYYFGEWWSGWFDVIFFLWNYGFGLRIKLPSPTSSKEGK